MDTKYWNIIDDVVDTSAFLVEDKPVAKVILAAVDSIVESKAEGISNTDIKDTVIAMAKSKMNDIKDADIGAIVDIIGNDIDLSFKTDESKKDEGILGKIWAFLSMIIGIAKPIITDPAIKRVLGYVEALVQAKDHGISNESIKNTLVSMSKSAWNSLDSTKIEKIMNVINKKDEK